MNREMAAGAGLTAVGVLGYVAGIRVAYPGRAFAVTMVMVGLTLVAIGTGAERNEEGPE